MSYKEWMQKVIETGNLCGNYQDKVNEAGSKLALMRIVLDANGSSFLSEMQSMGLELPYETILKEFGNYINGKYMAGYHNERGNGYTSRMYCCYSDDDKIMIDSTLTTILGCKTTIYIADNDFVHIFADTNSELSIVCPKSSRCIVEYWGKSKIDKNRSEGYVELIKH